MKWNSENEKRLMELKEQGCSTEQIAELLGTTPSSVKHKYIRLKQKNNAFVMCGYEHLTRKENRQ